MSPKNEGSGNFGIGGGAAFSKDQTREETSGAPPFT